MVLDRAGLVPCMRGPGGFGPGQSQDGGPRGFGPGQRQGQQSEGRTEGPRRGGFRPGGFGGSGGGGFGPGRFGPPAMDDDNTGPRGRGMGAPHGPAER